MKKKRIIVLSVLSVLGLTAALLFVNRDAVVYSLRSELEMRVTDFPATEAPDQICLTWSDDPSTSQTVQWRTATDVTEGIVQFRKSSAPEADFIEKTAVMHVLEEAGTSNDPVNHRFAAMMDGLAPGTAYAYRVGGKGLYSGWFEFTTAPETSEDFSFVYMGDPQTGLDVWGELLQAADKRHPETAFYVVAGDNVNRGNHREEWDMLFHAASGVIDRKPYVPAIGNHDCPGGIGPGLYLDLLALPENGPKALQSERAYRLDYGNALFLVLDSNAALPPQTAWMEEQLKHSTATWKFAVYHHPAYSSAPKRDNADIREAWGRLFDKYHVDVALQGHDHGYLRTGPMYDGKEAASPAEGTIYVVSVSGTKHYDVEQHAYAVKTLDHVSTYQVIDIETGESDKLTYRAYDRDGNVRDEFVIIK